MLRHQLACVNISFPIHISSHSIQAITCKQNTWMNFQSNHQSGLFNSPRTVRRLSMDNPLIKHRNHFFGTKIHGHFRPHNTQDHFHGLLNKEYPSRRRPLPLGVAENPQYWYPRVALTTGITLPPLGFDGSIVGKSRKKVELLSLKSLFFSLSFSVYSFSLFLSLPNQFGLGWVKRIVLSCHLSHSHWFLGFPLSSYPSTMDFHPITCYHMSLMGPI